MVFKKLHVCGLDDATGGADSQEEAGQLSANMEYIIRNGGFCFKETVMTGDPLGDTGELRKVLLGPRCVRYAARTGQNGHEHSVSARLDAVFTEL